jgi:hypothetical protein
MGIGIGGITTRAIGLTQERIVEYHIIAAETPVAILTMKSFSILVQYCAIRSPRAPAHPNHKIKKCGNPYSRRICVPYTKSPNISKQGAQVRSVLSNMRIRHGLSIARNSPLVRNVRTLLDLSCIEDRYFVLP